MQAIAQRGNSNRLLIFAMSTLLIMAFTWAAGRQQQAHAPAPDRNAEYSSRMGLSSAAQVQALQERLRTHPEDWQAYSELGLAYLTQARESGDPTYYQKAEEAFNQTLSKHPDDYAAISGMGALALARHQFHEAMGWGERARGVNPDRAYAYGVVVDAQVELGQYEQAVETLQSMVNLHPDMGSYARVSYLRELHGDNAGALEMMQTAVDAGTPNAEGTAWTRTQLGNLYFNTGRLHEAEAEYQQTLSDRPGYAYALAGLGRVRAAQGRLNEAIGLAKRASDLVPLPDFVILLGDLYQANHQRVLAQQQFKLIGAIETLYRSNGVDLDMEIALFNADHDRDVQGTLELARQAYQNRPSIHAADVLAWALYKTGQYEEARIYSEQALELGTQDALKLFHAGMIAAKLGERTQAERYLEQAVTLNPHFSLLYEDQARQALKDLHKQGETHGKAP